MSDDLRWALERLQRNQAVAETNAGQFGPKLLKGHGYPDEAMRDAQDALALRTVLSQLSALCEALDTHERMKAQALEIEALLREAGIGPCTLPEGVWALTKALTAWREQWAISRDVLSADIKTGADRVLTLELENQRLSEALSAAHEEIARLKATT